MSIEGMKFCDLCGELIHVDDIAPIKVERDGHLSQMHFHNRNHEDCLAQELSFLQEELTALQGELTAAAA